MIFLGIDSGTQSTKVVALDFSAGNILAEAQKSYDLISGLPSGHLEQNPSEWIDATGDAIQTCLRRSVRGVTRLLVLESAVSSMDW